jgi:hypothetical protein
MARAAITIILAVLLAAPAGTSVAEEDLVTCQLASKRRCDAKGCKSMKTSGVELQFRAGAVRRCKNGKCHAWDLTDRTILYKDQGKLDGVVISIGPVQPADRTWTVYNISRFYQDGRFMWGLTWSFTTESSIFARFGPCEGNFKSLKTN